ncbi:hypothetical protein OG988_09850 [Streptomyces zaomyceticus]|uniref:hypothetical protein n=1 Tax=Streptomyces zaomyceticus TaxID=68286 RepID=UPI003251F525
MEHVAVEHAEAGGGALGGGPDELDVAVDDEAVDVEELVFDVGFDEEGAPSSVPSWVVRVA